MGVTWSLLPLGMQRECATHGCSSPAAYEMEAGGVGSYYCGACRKAIEKRKPLLEVVKELREVTRETGVSLSLDDEALRRD